MPENDIIKSNCQGDGVQKKLVGVGLNDLVNGKTLCKITPGGWVC